jgi:hypothetical protein
MQPLFHQRLESCSGRFWSEAGYNLIERRAPIMNKEYDQLNFDWNKTSFRKLRP